MRNLLLLIALTTVAEAAAVQHAAPIRPRTWAVEDLRLADFSLQARFKNVKALHATVFFRARMRKGRVWRGTGVELRGRKMTLVHYKAGKRVRVTPSAKMRRYRDLEIVELEITALGEDVVVRATDPANGRFLAELHAPKVPPTVGALGVQGGRRWGSPSALLMFQTRDACDATPAPDEGRPVVLKLAPAIAERAAGGTALEQIDGQVIYWADVKGWEAVHCAGLPIQDVVTDLPWKWTDPGWLGRSRLPPRRTPTGFVIDDGYKNAAMSNALLKAYAQRFGSRAHYEVIGTSHEGREIGALLVSSDLRSVSGKPTILLNGGHHGDEPLSTEFVLDAAQQLRESRDHRIHEAMEHFAIWLVPLVNPDGNHAFLHLSRRAARKNGRDFDGNRRRDRWDGVDLNRNYPFWWGRLGERGSRSRTASSKYRGPSPASEPETQAMMQLAERERFVAAISYHTGTVALLAPYTIPGPGNPQPNVAWELGRHIAKAMPHHAQDRPVTVRKNLYAVDGTDQDWHMFAHGTLALLFEGALWTPFAPSSARNSAVETVRPSWMVMLKRLATAPRVWGYVVDAQGRGVDAEIRVRGHTLKNGERWTTRCRDGRFDRVLPKAGDYTIEILSKGQKPIVKRVRVEGSTRLDLRLSGSARGCRSRENLAH